MNIIYTPNYKPSNTKYRAWHHTGGFLNNPLASTAFMTALDVDQAHLWRFQFPSQYCKKPSGAPWYGGYNFFIERDGKITQFRAVGEETAANKTWNFDGVVISSCFAGNFNALSRHSDEGLPIDVVTERQMESACLLDSLIVKVPNKPHRFFNPTECYGDSLTDQWINDILKVPAEVQPPITELSVLQQMINKIRQLILELQVKINRSSQRLGGVISKDCLFADNRG